MKRDWNLFRVLLAHFESETIEDFVLNLSEWKEGQYLSDKKEEKTVFEHIILLIEAGYVKGISVNFSVDKKYSVGFINPQLTNAGHDFLQTLRSSSVWGKIKEISKTKGIELSFSVIKTLAAKAVDKICE